MAKISKKTIAIVTILFVLIVLIINISLGFWLSDRSKNSEKPVEVYSQEQKDKFSYKGEEGKDALTLLKQKVEVEEAGPPVGGGFVTSIDGRAADKNKREYWSFYVNGKPATVGAALYITKDTDLIEWKIEKY